MLFLDHWMNAHSLQFASPTSKNFAEMWPCTRQACLSGVLEKGIIALACEKLGRAGWWHHVSQAAFPVQTSQPPLQEQATDVAGQEGAVREEDKLELL